MPTDLVPVFHFSTAQAVAVRERANLLRHLAAANPDWDAVWLAAAEDSALAALARLGEAGAVEITAQVPALQATVTMSPGRPNEAKLRVGGWVLRLLAMQGRIRRSRPLGGWTSSQFRYVLAPEMPPLDVADAQAELVRRWLASNGPGTVDDVKWWTGWTVTEVHRALAQVGAVEVALAEGSGWVLPEDLDPPREPTEAWAAFLPSLDPATMGWKHRDWYLDPAHRPLLVDTAGNAGPTVWWDGEIIGAWAQRGDGKVVWRLLADRGEQARKAVESEVARLQNWLDDSGLVARFVAPLTRELTGSPD